MPDVGKCCCYLTLANYPLLHFVRQHVPMLLIFEAIISHNSIFRITGHLLRAAPVFKIYVLTLKFSRQPTKVYVAASIVRNISSDAVKHGYL